MCPSLGRLSGWMWVNIVAIEAGQRKRDTIFLRSLFPLLPDFRVEEGEENDKSCPVTPGPLQLCGSPRTVASSGLRQGGGRRGKGSPLPSQKKKTKQKNKGDPWRAIQTKVLFGAHPRFSGAPSLSGWLRPDQGDQLQYEKTMLLLLTMTVLFSERLPVTRLAGTH